MGSFTHWKLPVFIALLLGLAACTTASTSTPSEVPAIPSPTYLPTKPTETVLPTLTPAPTSTPELRTLTICLGAEPDTLFLYQSSMLVARSVLEAIYDGPIDSLGYSHQAVILEKLPSLADGDARIEPVVVYPGDQVIDDNGDVAILDEGDRVRPYGCNQTQCAVTYDGQDFEMGQLSADFTLLEDVHWSDGEPVQASDAVFSFKIAKQCDANLDWCVNNSLVEYTADFIALEQNQARWTGLPGYMDPEYMTNFFQPLPEHQLQDMQVLEMGDADQSARRPMGWGAYKIDKWEIGKEISLSRNPYYFRSGEGLPRFDQLVFKFTGENSPQNISKILAGECDLVDQDAQLEDAMNLLIGMDHEGLLQAHLVSGPVWEHLDFSLLHADYDDGYQLGIDRPVLFGDVGTRQAIAMCLDREKVINEAVFHLSESEEPYQDPDQPLYDSVYGLGEALNSYVPAEHPLYNAETPVYQFSPQEANRLLDEVGWIDHDADSGTPRIAQSVADVPAGTELEFNYWTTSSDIRQHTAQILADSMAKCGIKVNLEYWQPADFYEPPGSPIASRNFDLVQFAWLTADIPPCELFLGENIPGDPGVLNPDGTPRFPQGWEGQNNSGYNSLEYDQACYAAMAALPGQPGFVENHKLAQAIFFRDLPVIPIYQRIKVTAAGPELCGYRMDPTAESDTWGIEKFGLGDECDQ